MAEQYHKLPDSVIIHDGLLPLVQPVIKGVVHNVGDALDKMPGQLTDELSPESSKLLAKTLAQGVLLSLANATIKGTLKGLNTEAIAMDIVHQHQNPQIIISNGRLSLTFSQEGPHSSDLKPLVKSLNIPTQVKTTTPHPEDGVIIKLNKPTFREQ